MPDPDLIPQGDKTFDVTGKVAIVTGAGSGIGRATACVLASAGAVVMCADIDGASAAQTASLVGRQGGIASDATVDVSRREEVDNLVRVTSSQHGRLDAMCNIAGAIRHSPVLELTEDELDWSLDVNLKGALFGSQAAARVMVEQGGGSIVNMSSGTIDAMSRNVGAYAMAKAAVVQLTRSLALEIGTHGVRVNALAPGFVLTELTAAHYRSAGAGEDAEKRDVLVAEMSRAAALGRVGEPVDIGRVVLFLVSEASSFITGQVLRPNGGIVMPW